MTPIKIREIWIMFFGLVIGNYLWQYLNDGIYKVAIERSFFQLVPIILITIYIIGKKR